jgi:hypothetical protein
MTRTRWSILALAVVLTLAAEQVVHHKSDYWFSGIPGFYAIFGFVGCVVIIYASKWFGRVFVQRDEDYYDVHGDEDPHRAMSRPHRPHQGGGAGRPRRHSPAPPRGEET